MLRLNWLLMVGSSLAALEVLRHHVDWRIAAAASIVVVVAAASIPRDQEVCLFRTEASVRPKLYPT